MTGTLLVGLYVFVLTYIGLAAVIVATINVVGGYLVTDRMLEMFKKGPETG